MEQERKIEKWLRAYAKKRRAQAGESFKLDPATRRILQSEVSRSASPSENDDDTLSLWQVLRQQWMFLLGFAACVFVIASALFLNLPAAKIRSQFSTTLKLRMIGTATHQAAIDNGGTLPATLDALTNGYLLEKQLAEMKKGTPITYVAGGLKLSNLPNNAVIAYSTEEKNRRYVVFADGTVQSISETNYASLTSSRQPEIASSEPTMAPPAPSAPAEANYKLAQTDVGGGYPAAQVPNQKKSPVATASGELHLSFAESRQLEDVPENSFKNTIAPPTQSSLVLMNFQVSQNGNLIRVVDQDGSVYSGTLRPQEQEMYGGAPADKIELNGARSSTVERPKMEPVQTLNSTGQAAQASPVYAFRVEGMNRTLKQSVLFTGTLLGDLTMAKDVQQTFGISANAAAGAAYAQQLMKSERTNQAAQLPWSRLRIAGTAIINQTNRIEINATPVAPVEKAMGPK